MKTLALPGALALLLGVTLSLPALPQSTESEEEKARSRLERLVGELERELVPYAMDPALDSLSIQSPGESDFDLVLLADDNPAISDDCYKIVLHHASEAMMHRHPELGRHEALMRGIAHVREMRETAAGEGRTYGAFFRHVVDCQEWCQPLVAGLEKCHIEAVGQLGPRAVFFAYNDDQVQPEEAASLAAVATELGHDPDARVLLVGRASRIGDKLYNRELSERRTVAVQNALIEHGVEAARIQSMWIGWEPPQISSVVAGVYGFGDLYAAKGETAVNQSVMMVIF